MKSDLTRWNRSGLARFRYVDGNAATYLEALRRELVENRLPHWTALSVDVPADEGQVERLARLEAQYARVTREWGWEITRTFARCCHILTEHLDVYANESHLRTATQWDNVRRLVETIGYHPAPPASAATWLALLAKAGGQATVNAGFQVVHHPDEGDPVVFETLADLVVAAELNELRPAGWDVAATPLSDAAAGLWRLTGDESLSVGSPGVMVNRADGTAIAATVSAVGSDGGVTLSPADGTLSWDSWAKGASEFRFGPAAIHKARLNGPAVVSVDKGHGLVAGDGVAWKTAGNDWYFDTVQTADAAGVVFAVNRPAVGTPIYRLQTISADSGETLLLPGTWKAAGKSRTGKADGLSGVSMQTHSESSTDYGFSGSYRKVTSTGVRTVYMVPDSAGSTGRVTASPAAGTFEFGGRAGSLASRDWVVGEDAMEGPLALQVDRIDQREDAFSVSFRRSGGGGYSGTLTRFFGPLDKVLRPAGHDINPAPLGPDLTLGLPPGGTLPGLLTAGRWVMLERMDDAGDTVAAHLSTVRQVDHAGGRITLAAMPAADAGFTLGNTVLRANVVPAGHGETKPTKVLGSGDATRSFQSFRFTETGVAFTADSIQASGVQAAVTISVAGQTWQQVPRLDHADPMAPCYTVRMTEAGGLDIGFGDGRHGRRLPTGSGNVRITWRKGTGLAGNLPAGSLVKTVKPHAAVKAVRQPLASTGGNDMEPVASLRENAPAALFALERAVSATDYARLAQRHSSVWQALAVADSDRGAVMERVTVVVVPAGGGALETLGETLRRYLQENGLPGVAVAVENHIPVAVDLDVTIRVDSSRFAPEAVAGTVKQAIAAAFALKLRGLGQPLYRSQVYAVVEAVTGVASSDCRIDAVASVAPPPHVIRGPGGHIRVVRPASRQVLCFDPDQSRLVITTKEVDP